MPNQPIDPDFPDFDEVIKKNKKPQEEPEQPALEEISREELETQLNAADTKVAALEAKINEYKDIAVRAQAEIENVRRRGERDLSNAHKYGVERLAQELLPVIDNLERSLEHASEDNSTALKALKEGVELTLKLLRGALDKFQIKAINPIDQPFDPAFHEAMSMQPAPNKAPNTVLAVLQKGYLLHDRLLRPAMVVVSKAAE